MKLSNLETLACIFSRETRFPLALVMTDGGSLVYSEWSLNQYQSTVLFYFVNGVNVGNLVQCAVDLIDGLEKKKRKYSIHVKSH